jgi:membrane-associated phospholipid phosphatase
MRDARNQANDDPSREVTLLVTLVLLGPALVLGALFATVVRRHPGVGPASLQPATAIAVAIGGGVVFGALALLVRSRSSLLDVDRSVAPWGRAHTTPFARWMLDFVTSFGTTRVVIAITVGVLVVEAVRRSRPWLPVFLVVVVVGQTSLSNLFKHLLDRPRPTVNPIAHTLGPAFPSGHTTAAAACYAAFALVLGRGRSRKVQSMLAGVAMFMALAVAASRALLGVHWLSDVLGGLALGWGWFALCTLLFGRRRLGPAAPAEEDLVSGGSADSTPAPPGPRPRS